MRLAPVPVVPGDESDVGKAARLRPAMDVDSTCHATRCTADQRSLWQHVADDRERAVCAVAGDIVARPTSGRIGMAAAVRHVPAGNALRCAQGTGATRDCSSWCCTLVLQICGSSRKVYMPSSMGAVVAPK